MFNKEKHIFFWFVLIFVTGCFCSCKTKKEAIAQKNNTIRPQPAANDNNETLFAHLYYEGCNQRSKSNNLQALRLFEKCDSIIPGRAATAYELAMVNKLLGNNQKALNKAKICSSMEPKNEWYQLLLIDCYTALGQQKQALKVREELVKNFPVREDFKEELAVEYAMAGQYQQSLKIYEQIEKNYGISEQTSLNKVKLYKSQNKPAEAEKELLRLSESNKNELRYYAYLSDFYQELNQREKAKAMYDKMAALDPSNPGVNLALYDYYISKGQEAEAFQYLKKSFENPNLEVTTKANILSDYYRQAEQGNVKAFERGNQLAKIAVGLHPKAPETNGIYGDFLRLDGKEKEAVTYYYHSAINEKRNYQVWKNLLYVENRTGLIDSLERHSVFCMELFPSLPDGYLYNGVANNRLKNYDKAIQSLKDGLEFANTNASRLDFLKALGDAYNNDKEYSKSDKAFDDALKIAPDNTYVLNNYAYYLSVRNEQLDKAEKYSKRVNELSPGNGSYMDTYGWILYMQKKYAEAETWLYKAAKVSPGDATILEHDGDVLFRLGKTEEAVQQWNGAKNAGGNNAALLKKIKEKKISD